MGRERGRGRASEGGVSVLQSASDPRARTPGSVLALQAPWRPLGCHDCPTWDAGILWGRARECHRDGIAGYTGKVRLVPGFGVDVDLVPMAL